MPERQAKCLGSANKYIFAAITAKAVNFGIVYGITILLEQELKHIEK
jgi:ABC-type sulfate transport system permease subunit